MKILISSWSQKYQSFQNFDIRIIISLFPGLFDIQNKPRADKLNQGT